jgi:hydrogenase nickel incorporation protein HypA/HybF
MHELSLTMSILSIVEDYAKTHGFERVRALKLTYGRMSCIDPKALTFAFEIQAAGTRAEGASLNFDVRPIVVHCLACDKDSELSSYTAICPQCLSEDVMVAGGTEELRLVEMDVE